MYDLVHKSQLTEMAANSKPNSRNQDYSIRRQKGKFLHGKFLAVTLHGKNTNKRYGGRHADEEIEADKVEYRVYCTSRGKKNWNHWKECQRNVEI